MIGSNSHFIDHDLFFLFYRKKIDFENSTLNNEIFVSHFNNYFYLSVLFILY
jgi:hypothetical protein